MGTKYQILVSACQTRFLNQKNSTCRIIINSMRSFPFCETGRYSPLITTRDPRLLLPKPNVYLLPKVPLVKLPGIKLYPSTWLDCLCQAKFSLHHSLPVFSPNLLSKKIHNFFFTGKTTLSGKVLFCVFYIKGKAGEALLIAMSWLYLRKILHFKITIQNQRL